MDPTLTPTPAVRPAPAPEQEPELKLSKDKNEITNKVILVVGAIFTVALIAIAISAHADPQAFGDIADKVFRGSLITASFFAICLIAYPILNKITAKKESEHRQMLEESLTHMNDVRKQGPLDRMETLPSLFERDPWNQRLETASPSTNREKYHNLVAPGKPVAYNSPLSSGLRQLPHVSKYKPDGMAVKPPHLEVRLPSNHKDSLPESVRRAIGDDPNVEIFFLVMQDSVEADNARDLFLHPLYLRGNREIQVRVGIYEAENIESLVIDGGLWAHPDKPRALPHNRLENRNVIVHDDNSWSPNSTQFTLTDPTQLTSFYSVSKSNQKTTVAHIILIPENRADGTDSKILGDAAIQATPKEFLRGIERLHSDELREQIYNEFNYEPPRVVELL